MTARILIVDDMPANTRLLEAKLSAAYYQVATAQDGFEGLQLASSWQPDLILLDVMMPGMDGYETCRRLKDDSDTLHIPVVMVTALGERSERVRGLEAGADDFLTKPVELDTLLARVRSLVRLKRLLDEWCARGETARALALTGDRLQVPSVAGARALVVDDWELGAQIVQDALARECPFVGSSQRYYLRSEVMAARHTAFVARVEASLHGLGIATTELKAHEALQIMRETVYRERRAAAMWTGDGTPARRRSRSAPPAPRRHSAALAPPRDRPHTASGSRRRRS